MRVTVRETVVERPRRPRSSTRPVLTSRRVAMRVMTSYERARHRDDAHVFYASTMGDTGCDLVVVCIPCVVTTTRTCDVRRLAGCDVERRGSRHRVTRRRGERPPQSHCRRSGKAVI